MKFKRVTGALCAFVISALVGFAAVSFWKPAPRPPEDYAQYLRTLTRAILLYEEASGEYPSDLSKLQGGPSKLKPPSEVFVQFQFFGRIVDADGEMDDRIVGYFVPEDAPTVYVLTRMGGTLITTLDQLPLLERCATVPTEMIMRSGRWEFLPVESRAASGKRAIPSTTQQ